MDHKDSIVVVVEPSHPVLVEMLFLDQSIEGWVVVFYNIGYDMDHHIHKDNIVGMNLFERGRNMKFCTCQIYADFTLILISIP